MTNPLEPAKEGIALVGELMKAAGDNPEVREAGKQIGSAALTVARTINNALLPLAAVNFAFDKAKAYFGDRFQADLSSKAAGIPPEKLIEPKASIAGPALQGLAFTHEEPNLKDMYLSLIATAMDGRKVNESHPAFVEIIKQLDSEEADLLRGVLRSTNAIAIVEIRETKVGKPGWFTIARHLLNLRHSATNEPKENPGIAAMVDNWVRLGLVEVDYAKHLMGKDSYSWVDSRPEYKKLCDAQTEDGVKITTQNGILVRTALGLKFAQAAGLM